MSQSELSGSIAQAMASRRRFLARSLVSSGLVGFPALLRAGVLTPQARSTSPNSVILLWLNGGAGHLDTWDPKPMAPREIRGPFSAIPTAVSGVFLSEHLSRQAQIMDRLTIIRSADCTDSGHLPNHVLQTGHRDAAPRRNKQGRNFPAIAAVASKWCGSCVPGIPASVAFYVSKQSVALGGWLGQQYDPFDGNIGPKAFELTPGLSKDRIKSRRRLASQLSTAGVGPDLQGHTEAVGRFDQQAAQIVLSGRAKRAFDLSLEPQDVRERYNAVPWVDQFEVRGQMNDQVLLARRLVEFGARFVTVVLSAKGNSATWDTHGNPVKVGYGGVETGTKPLLPPTDHLLATLVEDLEERGLLDQTLVVAMGEFGRSPRINHKTGRDHWPAAASIVLAGGGLRHGGVIGSTDRIGGEITERRVTPGDIAATIYRHLRVPLDAQYLDGSGRPRNIVVDGAPISELF